MAFHCGMKTFSDDLSSDVKVRETRSEPSTSAGMRPKGIVLSVF